MLKTEVLIEFDDSIIPERIDAAAEQVLPLGAERIAKRAKESIRPSRQLLISELPPHQRKYYRNKRRPPQSHSEPGKPPLTPSGILPRLISTAQEGPVALVGPRKREGRGFPAGGALEFGRTYSVFGRRVTIEPRPFMAPALVSVLPTLAQDFKDSVRE